MRLWAGKPRRHGLIPAGARDFSLFQRVYSGSGAHPTFIQCVLEALFLGVKWLKCEGGRLPPSNVQVKVSGAVTLFPYILPCCAEGHIYLYIIFGLMLLVNIFCTGNSLESRTRASSSLFGYSMHCSASIWVGGWGVGGSCSELCPVASFDINSVVY